MRRTLVTGLFLILSGLLSGLGWSKDGLQAPARTFLEKVSVAVTERIDDRGDARVIVHLNTPVVRERKLTPAEKTAQRQVIADAQARFASELSAAGAVSDKVFSTVPAVALRADAAVLDVLTRSGLVATVTLDILARPSLHESNLVIESDHMWAQNPAIKGAGHAVAVLDTGVESGHTMFADGSGNSRVAAEFCASTNLSDSFGVRSTSFCPDRASASSANGSGADCAANISGCGHGTHVAGIAAGSPVALSVGTVSGVAPEADIIAVQVFSEFGRNSDCNNRAPCALSWSSDQMLALEHVLSLKESGAFNVASVNMSLGSGKYTASCDRDSPTYLGVINNLVDSGIAVVISSGNDSFSNAVGSPACHSTAIAVSSTTKQDRVSYFSNVGDGLVDLYAPGSSIASASLGDSYRYLSGTSMAAPHVAGAWALMHEATNDATEREVESVLYRLQLTGTAIGNRESGAAIGFNVPRINIEQASQPTGLPGAPTDVSASAGNREATISWTVPISNGGYAITGYTVTASPSGLTCNTTGATSCTMTGLSNGTSYTFTVVATNSVGNSASSSASNAVTPVYMRELASGVAVRGLSGAEGSDQYFFIEVSSGVESLIVSLDVDSGDPDIYVDTEFPPPGLASVCSSILGWGIDETCTITSPVEGRYYIRLRAYSAFSGASLTVVAGAPPGRPTIRSIASDVGSLVVGFSAGSGGAADSYALTCVDQGVSRAGSSGRSPVQSSPHYQDTQPMMSKGVTYSSAQAFHESRAFQEGAYRCATHEHDMFLRTQPGYSEGARTADCTNSATNIQPDYDPVVGRTVVIPLYFHVIYRTDGTGYVSRQRIDDQIAVLNDDFAGTTFSGDSGFETTIQFELVAVNYVQSNDWYTDAGPRAASEFKSSLVRRPQEQINIYTNDAGGSGVLGYATLPAGQAGTEDDGVVMLHNTIGGRNNGYGNYNQGRTLVHEVGHYLGLLHTFDGGVCSNTYTTQDLIVDTPAQSSPDYGSSASTDCGVTSAIENFMNYSVDSAMYTFTEEQTNRMICSQTSYRPDGYSFESAGTFTATGASSPLTVTGLTNGNRYSCSVVATNSAGSSAASAAVTAIVTPAGATAPGIPTITSTDYGDGQVTLRVSVTDNGGADITRYDATCTTNSSSGGSTYGTSGTSPITVSGLTNDVAYTCTVTATNSVGTSSASAATDPITPEATSSGLPIWLLYQVSQ
jgi:hypothetical protein